MTEQDIRGSAGEETGSGARRGSRRVRAWIMAIVLVGVGAAGGALTTVAIDAGAHGWRGGDGWAHGLKDEGVKDGFRHRWHRRVTDPDQAIERLQRVSAWALGSVDATDEQRERIDEILAAAVNDLFPLRDEHRSHRRDLIAELARPQLDRAALERVRTAELALADTASARLLDATVAVAEVLDPEQRRQLVERIAKRHRH